MGVGELEVCADCIDAKARKAKDVPKSTLQKASCPGERLFIDISGPYAKSVIGSKFWILVMDNYSRMKWSFFRKKKSKIGNVLDKFVEQLNGIN